ncbi:hypothetical protein JIQ42_01608 [Leishmania sp. Namibia]|uniref:hypothetical protein n=1 Tax=Leishmania sp. Namibia TaxID=2802991 RepID=UPI001B55F945|nr:hypothetical protein JIQ42_01608 [Leishmania sp. Namibia]
MVKHNLTQVPVRVPSTRARTGLHSVDAARNRKCFPSLAVIGAAAGDSSTALADEASRCRRPPAVPTTPKRAEGWISARQLRRGSSGSAADENIRRARERRLRLPSVNARGNNVGERDDNAGPSHQSRRPMSAMATVGLPREHSLPLEAAPVPADGLTSEDLLLLCGVQPGTSKALWYTTMRAQLEARVLASPAEYSGNGDTATAKGSKSGEATPLLVHSQAPHANACSEPLVLPSKLFLLTESSDLNPLWNPPEKAAARSATGQRERVPPTNSIDCGAEGAKEGDDDGDSSFGTRYASLSSRSVSNASARKAPPNALPWPSLKKLQLSPQQRQQMYVSVLSLKALSRE